MDKCTLWKNLNWKRYFPYLEVENCLQVQKSDHFIEAPEEKSDPGELLWRNTFRIKTTKNGTNKNLNWLDRQNSLLDST